MESIDQQPSMSISTGNLVEQLQRLLHSVEACHDLLKSVAAASARHRRRLLTAPQTVQLHRRRLLLRLRRGVFEQISQLRVELHEVSRSFATISGAAATAGAFATVLSRDQRSSNNSGGYNDEPSTRDDEPTASTLSLPGSGALSFGWSSSSTLQRPAADDGAGGAPAGLHRAIAHRLAQSGRLLDRLAADLRPPPLPSPACPACSIVCSVTVRIGRRRGSSSSSS